MFLFAYVFIGISIAIALFQIILALGAPLGGLLWVENIQEGCLER